MEFLKETNLDEIKKIAIKFLNIEPTITIGPFVTHPFFNTIVLFDGNEMFNIFEDKDKYNNYIRNMENVILKKQRTQDIISRIEKPYKMYFLYIIMNYLEQHEFSELLIDTWTMIENPCSNSLLTKRDLIKMFKSSCRENMMSKREKQTYDKFPDEITIYRGVRNKKYKNGLSWTTDKETAIFFATRFSQGTQILYSTTINKKDIIVYTNQRKEREIIINPYTLRKYNIEEVLL